MTEIDFWDDIYAAQVRGGVSLEEAAKAADAAVMARRERVHVPLDQRIETAADKSKRLAREAERERYGDDV